MMLKFFFWILLFANAGLLAYQQGALDSLLPNGREPARIANQLNADKIRLIPPAEAKPEAVPAAEPATAQAEKPAEVLACIEIGNFNPEEAKRFSTELAGLALGERVSQRPIQEVSSHMVFIPPQGDRETAERKAEQLRQLGVTDFFIIQDNPALRWGISLGVFKQEEAARAHLAQLNRQGVRTARIVQRGTNTGMVAFQLRKIDAQVKGTLDTIKARFPKQSMRECEPA